MVTKTGNGPLCKVLCTAGAATLLLSTAIKHFLKEASNVGKFHLNNTHSIQRKP
jgi:hypothetical protein